MYFLDLFAGIGGFALGARWAGLEFEEHYFSEVDPYAIQVYQRHFPESIGLGDIKRIRGQDLPRGEWILSGGFPCQDISVAGRGAGLEGARSGLWFEYARLIGELRPRYAVMENVGALAIRGLDRVLGSLAEVGYDAEWQDLRASDVGAPHRRERLWIVAYPRLSEPPRWDPGKEGIEHPQRGTAWGVTASRRGNVADPDGERLESLGQRSLFDGLGEALGDDPHRCGSPIRNPDREGLEEREGEPGHDGEEFTPAVGADWWAVEPGILRVAHGVPNRVHRLRCLGNSIVPRIAQLIFESIAKENNL